MVLPDRPYPEWTNGVGGGEFDANDADPRRVRRSGDFNASVWHSNEPRVGKFSIRRWCTIAPACTSSCWAPRFSKLPLGAGSVLIDVLLLPSDTRGRICALFGFGRSPFCPTNPSTPRTVRVRLGTSGPRTGVLGTWRTLFPREERSNDLVTDIAWVLGLGVNCGPVSIASRISVLPSRAR